MMHVTLGPAQVHDPITVFPLLSAERAEPPYDLLADALAAGTVRIGEVGQGMVPALKAINSGGRDVLVLDGEQLIGARQNRMTNRSILLPALATTEIPVSCMEQGRWRFESDAMAPAPQHSPAKVRRRARETEVRHATAGGSFSIEELQGVQGEVWEEIADLMVNVGGDSATGALDRAYAVNAGRLASLERAFLAVPRQVGLLVFVGGAVIGLDVVGGRALYGRLHARLLRGYLMDALDRAAGAAEGTPPAAPETGAAERYLELVREARRHEAQTVGKGSYRVLSGAVVGGELADGGRLAHLSAFPVEERRGGSEADPRGAAGPVAPPSWRRTYGRPE